MALTERLALLITADGAGAINEMKKVGAAADKELGKTEDRTKKVGTQMQATGVAMMGAAAVIGAGMYQAGKAAADLEQAVGGTEAVFKTSSKTIDAWAKGADKSAGLSEEAARRLTTQLGGALQGLGYAQDEAAKKSVELTQIGGDLAATYGGTTKDAVEALGSAFRGEFDPLEQFNIFLKQSEVDAKAVSMGLARNTEHVDKHARAQATLAMVMDQSTAAQGQFGREQDTTSGRMAIATAQAENAKAALGEGFMPVMSKVAGVVGGAATKFVELDGSMGGNLSTITSWGVVALGSVGAASTLIGTVLKMKDTFGAAASGAKGMASAIGDMGFAKAAAGAGILAVAVIGVQKDIEHVQDTVKNTQTDLFKGIDFTDLEAANAKLNEAGGKINDMGSQWDRYNTLEQIAHHDEGAALDASKDQYEQHRQHVQANVDVVNRLASDMGVSATVAADMVKAIKVDPSSVGYDELKEKLTGVKSGTIDATQANIALTASGKDAEDVAKEQAKALDKARDALKAYFDQAFGTVDAERALADSQAALSKTIQDNNKINWAAFDNSTKAGRENRAAFEDTAKAALDLAMNNIKAGGDIGQNTQMVNQQVDALRKQMIAHGFSAAAVDNYIAQLNLTPAQVSTAFSAPGLKEAAGDAERLHNALSGINVDLSQSKGGVGTVSGGASILGRMLGGTRASGGPVMANTPYLVGEQGPEIVVPGASGVVVPARDSAAIMSGSGGGDGTKVIENHITLHIDGKELVSAIQRHEVSIN